MVDVFARAPAGHRRGARRGRTTTGGPGTGRAPVVPDTPDEWLTSPIPRVAPGPQEPDDRGADDADPATEQFAAVAPEASSPEPAPASRRPERSPTSRATRRRAAGRGRAVARCVVLAVLTTLVASGATAVAADKVVTVAVDGHERVVHTFADDVAGALTAAGIVATPQDRLEPAPTTELADGDQVILQRARPLTLLEGGSQRRIWTTAASVDEALRDVGVEAEPIQMSAAPTTEIPLGGMAVELRVTRSVRLVDGAGEPQNVTTNVGTVGALLVERGLRLGLDDVAVPAGDTSLSDGMDVQVVRNGVGEVVEIRRIPPPEEVVDDPEMPRGTRQVVEKGRPGEQVVVMRVHVSNGAEVRREQVRAGATTPPEKRVVKVGTNDDVAVAPIAGQGVWDDLAKCEAGGNWSINTGNGYYGGLQFDRQTWVAYGGDDYAALPHQADRDAQIAVASKVRDARGGYGSWPACARKLGLPR